MHSHTIFYLHTYSPSKYLTLLAGSYFPNLPDTHNISFAYLALAFLSWHSHSQLYLPGIHIITFTYLALTISTSRTWHSHSQLYLSGTHINFTYLALTYTTLLSWHSHYQLYLLALTFTTLVT